MKRFIHSTLRIVEGVIVGFAALLVVMAWASICERAAHGQTASDLSTPEGRWNAWTANHPTEAPAVAAESVLSARAAAVAGPVATTPTCPTLPTWCKVRLPCPYPQDSVSAAESSALRAKVGPWRSSVPESQRMGLADDFPNLESLRLAAWDLPYTVEGLLYGFRTSGANDMPGINGSAQYQIGEVLKPAPSGGRSWTDLGTGEYGHQCVAAWRTLYAATPTYGQYVAIDANHLAPGSPGQRWWSDGRLTDALICRNVAADEPAFPNHPSGQGETWWSITRETLAGVGYVLRDADGAPVSAEDITCHFRPDTCGTEPPVEPPPKPSPCLAWEGSPCAARCQLLGKTDEASCLAAADAHPGTQLANLCTDICRDEIPGGGEPGKCYAWTPEDATVGSGDFVPSILSTGHTEVQLILSGQWTEVECPPNLP